MAIRVAHEPVRAIAEMGYTAGLGNYRRWQAEQQLRRQALAQDDIQQQRAIAAQLFGQRQNLQAQLARDFAQQKFDQARIQDAQQFQLQRDQADEQGAMNRLAQDQQFRAGLAEEQRAMEAAQEERLWSGGVMDAMQKAQKEGYLVNKLEYDKAYADYQRVMKDPSLSQDEKWIAAGEARRRVEAAIQSAKPSPDGPPMTLQQKVEQGAYAQPVTGPNGEFMGWNTWTETIRNGSPQLTPKFIPYKPPDDPAKDYAAFVDKFIGKDKPAGPDETPKQYTPDDIRRMWAERQEALAGMASKEPPPPPLPPPNVTAPGMDMNGDGMPDDQPPPPAPSIDQQTAEMAQGVLPRPASPEEARKLPPGTMFMTPDGRILRVPQR